MKRWYKPLLRLIEEYGNKLWIQDSNGLLKDKNFYGELLSLKYKIHQYHDDTELILFEKKNESFKIIIYSDDKIPRFSNKFQVVDLNLSIVFPDLDLNILKNMDVSYFQKIYDYYNILNSQNKPIDTEQIIFQSVWNVDVGNLHSSPIENLKIALSYLVDNKDFDENIINIVSNNLRIDLKSLKKGNFLSLWIESIILNYIDEINNEKPLKYDLSDDLIRFYLSKIELDSENISKHIDENTIKKAQWVLEFKDNLSEDFIKKQIKSDISKFKELLKPFKIENFDLNQIDKIFDLSRLFFKIYHEIQYQNFSFNEFCDIENSYSILSNLFKKLIDEDIFNQLFDYPYDKKPYTLNKVLDHISYNFKNENFAIILFDGMSYDEWLILKKHLTQFNITEKETFAILPTITSYSRTSFFTGKLPQSFIQKNTKVKNNEEEAGFKKYFEDKGIDEKNILFGRIDLINNHIKTKKDNIPFEYLRGYGAIGLISNLFDDLSHEKVYNKGKFNLYKKIDDIVKSSQLIPLLEKLKEFGYKVILSSDHGNIFCKGNGIKYDKNLDIDKKSKRCLIYNNEVFADKIIEENPEKLLKYSSNTISDDLFFVLACENYFFGNKDSYSITHGSFMIEEWIVPMVILE
ncbi:MAG: PglZ domain-containing protein [Methanobrevibacter sp.]|jgi:hypothetical protein|nr:PglZ domain-containing protein [Methanobrevibacter sp.]